MELICLIKYNLSCLNILFKNLLCRICSKKVENVLDLGCSPPANSLLDYQNQEITSFPLVLQYCKSCSNLQLKDCLEINELYKHYFYLTPNSKTLNEHYEYLSNFLISKKYLSNDSKVLEIGSNVGNYLSHIKKYVKEIIGVDPAENIAKLANAKGIKTICDFFSFKFAQNLKKSEGEYDAIIARHCFAHNSSPHDLLKGAKEVLSKDGYLIIENAYALNTIENNEFDQIYHEHMFYYSIKSISVALEINGLKLIDILISLVHGGSIVFIAEHIKEKNFVSNSVETHLEYEQSRLNEYSIINFSNNAFKLKKDLKNMINISNKKNNKIYTYGATAKGNTLLNFVGLDYKNISHCIDSTNIKHGKYLPGSNIKIFDENFAFDNPPDYFLLTAWNYKDEIITKVRDMGNVDSTFIVPFPKLHVI